MKNIKIITEDDETGMVWYSKSIPIREVINERGKKILALGGRVDEVIDVALRETEKKMREWEKLNK